MLTYGLRKGTERDLVFIKDAEKGLKCGCVCPCCNQPLEARKGKVRKPHFSHAPGYEDCKGGRMTAIHLMAQNVLAREKKVMLPAFDKKYSKHEAELHIFDRIALEVICKNEDSTRRPDCVGYKEGSDQTLWIEVFCTNELKPDRIEDIKKRRQYCVEIDFSDLLEIDNKNEDNSPSKLEDEVRYRLIEDSSHSKWICCPVWEAENERGWQNAAKKEQEERERELRQAKEEKEHYEYIRQLANEWYDQPNKMIADEITKEIKRDPYTDIDAHKQGMYECLIPSSAWASEYIKFPRNIYGLQVFNCLIHYYYQKIRLDDRSHKRWKVLDTPMWTLINKQGERNAEEKILLEFMIVLWALNLLNNHRRYSDHDSELAKIFSYKYNVRKGLIDIMSRGGDRSLFLEKEVREKIRQEYSGKEDGETIMQVFEVCFPIKLYKDTILNSQSTHNPQPLISPESERGPQYSMSIQEAVAAVNKAFEEQEKERKRKVEDLEE